MSKPRWERAGSFCPGCGSRETWRATGEGDYYTGPEYVCLGCNSSGAMWEAEPAPKGKIAAVRRVAEGAI